MSRRHATGVSALALISAAALLASTSAHAQIVAAAAPPPAAAGPPSSATVAEVVVTAEKREQNLQTVPVAVTAFTAKERDLIGIESLQDLSDYTPGLQFNTLTNRPYIRGIGRDTDNLATESGVAIYQDGVYFGANASTLLQLDSLFFPQIEVLRGPQSTLYGRNADGGAINFTSRRPTDTYYAEGRAGYDNYNKYWVEGVVSGPIGHGLDFLVGGNYTKQTGGYYDNLDGHPEGGSVVQGGNGDSYHIEAQLQAKFSDKVDGWVKFQSNGFDASWHTYTEGGPFGQGEFPNSSALSPNNLYGLCALTGGAGGLGCTGPESPDTIVPGSVVTLANTPTTNPANANMNNFDADMASSSRLTQNYVFAGNLAYHADGFDVKWTGGWQTFNYYLNYPYNVTSNTDSVESYQLQGPPGYGNLTIDPAGEQVSFIEKETFFSNEFDISSTTKGPVQWIAGLYWYHEVYSQPVNVLEPNQPQIFAPANGPANPTGCIYCEYTHLDADSYAGFAQVDWKIIPTLKLTGGIRYTADHKYGFEGFRALAFDLVAPYTAANYGAYTPALDITSALAPVGVQYPGTGVSFVDSSGQEIQTLDAWWRAVTGTGGLEWTPTDDTLVYAKYSRGYKTGGFNSGLGAANPETQPEFVNAWEAGLKRQWLGGTLQTNLSAFYYVYENDQIPLEVEPAGGGPVATLVFNVPSVHTKGVELETIWRPVKPLTISLNYAYLDSTIASTGGHCFEDAADPTATEPGANTTGCTNTPDAVQVQNTTGAHLPQTAPNKISLNALYNIEFEPGTLTLSGSYIYRGAEYFSIFNRYYNEAPSYSQVNLRASFTDTNNRYTLIVFMDNVTNALGYDGAVGYLINSYPQTVARQYTLTPPRTFGVEVQYRFR
jgi:iron complex outermembrane receptor protein